MPSLKFVVSSISVVILSGFLTTASAEVVRSGSGLTGGTIEVKSSGGSGAGLTNSTVEQSGVPLGSGGRTLVPLETDVTINPINPVLPSPSKKLPKQLPRNAGPDSSSVRLQSAKPMHLDARMPNIEMWNEQFEDLARCPNVPVCKNANGVLVGGGVENCPDVCTVTREVYAQSGGRSLTRAAICPPTYAAVATYNVQDEYDNFPVSDVFPRSMTEMNTYTGNGYTCYPDSASGTYRTSTTCNSTAWYYSQYFITDDTYVGYISSTRIENKMYCVGSCGSSWCRIYDSGVAHDSDYYWNWKYIKCHRPAGVYKTSRQVPASVVCTRTHPSWQRSTN